MRWHCIGIGGHVSYLREVISSFPGNVPCPVIEGSLRYTSSRMAVAEVGNIYPAMGKRPKVCIILSQHVQ
jgi:hypothetical protein